MVNRNFAKTAGFRSAGHNYALGEGEIHGEQNEPNISFIHPDW